MRKTGYMGALLAGAFAGAVAGLFGAGGGMVLVPLLTLLTNVKDRDVFPCSVSIILPICVVTLAATAVLGSVDWRESLPYLLGSAAGGVLAGRFGRNIPAVWLHRGLGILILWGGYRYLC